MKPLGLIFSPTRHRRLNEILGLIVLVVAGLMLLALASYTPSDPSLDTVGGAAASGPAHNWTGIVGAYFADGMLQTIGIAAFFLPLLLVRTGVCWMRSRSSGSPLAKVLGLVLWVVFAPAAIALLPSALWLRSLPLCGLTGGLVADAMIHFLNVPGTAIVVTLMVALALYLGTTFSFNTAREWMTEHFRFVAWMRDKWLQFRNRNRADMPAGDARRVRRSLRRAPREARPAVAQGTRSCRESGTRRGFKYPALRLFEPVQPLPPQRTHERRAGPIS